MRRAVAAFAVLVAGCTHGTPAARPTTPPPSTTPPPPATPSPQPVVRNWDPADPRCRVARAAEPGSGQTFAFTDARVGVVTQGGWLYRTTDGGATWRFVRDFGDDVYDVVPGGCSTLYAVGGGAVLYRSDDGGATWRSVYTGPPQHLDFVTPAVGFGYYDESDLYLTRDGGRNWGQLGLAERGLGSVSAANALVLVAVERRVLRSTDGGTHFVGVLGGVDSATVVFAPSGREAWATGIPRHGGGYAVWHSIDAGLHWHVIASGPPPEEPARAMAAYGSSVLVAGDDGITLVTERGPARRVSLPAGVNRLQWVDARHAYASIPDVPTRLFATADGGATWRELSLP